MTSFRMRLWRALVTGAVWAMAGGVIAFMLLPIYVYVARPWEDGFFSRFIYGPGSQVAPIPEQVLQAAAGFALLGSAVGFIGGFCSSLRSGTTAAGE